MFAANGGVVQHRARKVDVASAPPVRCLLCPEPSISLTYGKTLAESPIGSHLATSVICI